LSQVTLSLGSNIDAENNLRKAIAVLRAQYSSLELSSVYESESVGFDGDNFLNLVAVLETERSLTETKQFLKSLEDEQGRDRSSPRFSGRTLDIDILTWDDSVGEIEGVSLPRDEIVKNAFVLQPLAELLPQQTHPVLKQTFEKLWAEYDKNKQKLWPIPFSWAVSESEPAS